MTNLVILVRITRTENNTALLIMADSIPEPNQDKKYQECNGCIYMNKHNFWVLLNEN